jgi:hypothetical protein
MKKQSHLTLAEVFVDKALDSGATRRRLNGLYAGLRRILAAPAFLLAFGVTSVYATVVGIQGTMSNFDVFNQTGGPVYGAELDLDGIHMSSVTKTYPSHFSSVVESEYVSGSTFGTRFLFTGYTFNPPNNFIIPTVGMTTNGHYAVNVQGAEHFGFADTAQPSATRFYWLNQSSQPITAPLSIPSATWTFVPPANPGAAPIVQAVLAPVPPPPVMLYPDAVWVKTYVTELTKQVDLNELISAPPGAPDSVAPQLPSEVEAEWELLPGDSLLPQPDIQLAEFDQSIVRRYEFYKYTGGYDEVHLPTSSFTGGTPDPNELGQFIAANMVAANLEVVGVPEPSTTTRSDAACFDHVSIEGVIGGEEVIPCKNSYIRWSPRYLFA